MAKGRQTAQTCPVAYSCRIVVNGH